MQSYHFKKSLAISLFSLAVGQRLGEMRPTFADSVLYPLAVKAKASDEIFFEKSDQKNPIGLDGI